MSGPPSDQELIQRVRERDHEALALLYDRYAPAVYSLALHMLRERRAAEDVVQDAFLTVWQQPASYVSERGAFGPWILRVARNRAIDLLRRGSRERVHDDERGTPFEERIVDPDPDPSEQLWTHAVAEKVGAALRELSPAQREVVELAYFRGMTQSQMAAYLGVPLGTIKTRVRTALRRLAHILEEAEVWTDIP
ncbi:MAG: sigma-70 family RNA polymerase sigma factor [Sphaerobacter sp.]|nr:sigma-70 family RNA polymerase sigma factor [Sphaerobacter sp.]